MAIDLSRKRSSFNFFESFSDLVFCALVMFLVLVLFLAAQVGRRAEAVEVSAREVAERRAVLAEVESELAAGRGRLEERQSQLDALQTQLATARALLAEQTAAANRRADQLVGLQAEIEAEADRLRRIAGADRFVSVREAPRLTVAFVWPNPDEPPRVQPVPASLLAEFRKTADLAPARREAVFSELRGRFFALSQDLEPLTPEQYTAVVRSVTEARPPGGEPVRLEETFRPDLSMVVTGAVAPDFAPLWDDPAREDNLRERLRTGRAYRLLWPEGRPEPEDASLDRPTLGFALRGGDDDRRVVLPGGVELSQAQFRRVLEAIAGGQLTVAFEPGDVAQDSALPAAFVRDVLAPTGFVVRSPDPEALREGRLEASESPPAPDDSGGHTP